MTWGPFSRTKEHVAGVFLLAMTLSHIVLVPGLLPFLRSGYPNFAGFYTAGDMVRRGQTTSLYNLSAQYQLQKQFAPDVRIRQAALPYYHPPFEAILFWPFTFLGYWRAYLFWTALNLAMVTASLVELRRQFAEIGTLSPAFVVLAAAGFVPLFGAIHPRPGLHYSSISLRTRGRHIQKGERRGHGRNPGVGSLSVSIGSAASAHPGGAAMAIVARICAGRRLAGPCIAGNAWMAGCRRLRASRFDSGENRRRREHSGGGNA
jgi:hypothetical protein